MPGTPTVLLARADDRTSTPLELFFDLAFAAAIAMLDGHLREQPSLARVAVYAALFVPVWWMWVVQTFAADRVDDGSLTHRLLVLGGVVAVAGVAAGAGGVPGEGDVLFVAAYLLGRTVPALLYVRGARGDRSLRRIAATFGSGTAVASALWLLSLLVTGPGRYLVWAGAVVVELTLPFLGRSAVSRTRRSPSHLSERYGLFTLVVLGESLLGPVEAARGAPAPPALVAGVIAVAVTGCLWWAYFSTDEPHPAFTADFARLQVFSLGHLPLTLAVALIGTGGALLVEGAAHEGGAPSTVGRVCLYGGCAVFLLAAAAIRAAFTGWDAATWLRVGAAGGCAVLGLVAARVPVLVGALVLVAVLVVLLVVEGLRRGGRRWRPRVA